MKNKSKKKKPALLTTREYAQACGVSKTIIFRRIKNGSVKPCEERGGVLYIDANKYPPSGPGTPGRRVLSFAEQK